MTDAEKIDRLLDMWIWRNDEQFLARIPAIDPRDGYVHANIKGFPTRELARAAIRKAAGIEEEQR